MIFEKEDEDEDAFYFNLLHCPDTVFGGIYVLNLDDSYTAYSKYITTFLRNKKKADTDTGSSGSGSRDTSSAEKP